jgi:hypothetical protein
MVNRFAFGRIGLWLFLEGTPFTSKHGIMPMLRFMDDMINQALLIGSAKSSWHVAGLFLNRDFI